MRGEDHRRRTRGCIENSMTTKLREGIVRGDEDRFEGDMKSSAEGDERELTRRGKRAATTAMRGISNGGGEEKGEQQQRRGSGSGGESRGVNKEGRESTVEEKSQRGGEGRESSRRGEGATSATRRGIREWQRDQVGREVGVNGAATVRGERSSRERGGS